ncbi:upf0481 protein, partial [Quercus suber]
IGSSSNANGSRDLVPDIKAMFESSKHQFSIGGMIIVPDHLCKVDEQAFTPLLISVGPIHCSNAKLQTMKKCKVRFCECLIQRTKIDLKNLVERIRAREKEIRSYYAKSVVSCKSSDDFVTMILVDGMFLLVYVLISYSNLKLAFEFFGEYNIHRLAFRDFNANIEHFTAFKDFNGNIERYKAFKDFYANIEHFTDLVRFFYLIERKDILGRLHGGAKVKKYTATQLHEACVTFKVDGVMEISCITLNDENIRLIRNIIALEQSRYVWHPFVTDFFVMLDFLIDNSKDVDLLCDKGILINYLGDSDVAALVVNSLNTNILWVNGNPKYLQICKDLNSFYNITWHKWKARLWCQYFSTPWRATSTSATIILLLFTAIQTLCSLKSTKW